MMSKEAKAARAAYMREWRKKNPEKKKQYEEAQWERKAKLMKQEKEKNEMSFFLREDIFDDEIVKKIENRENGYVLTNIMVKLSLLVLKNGGVVDIEGDFSNLAKKLGYDENVFSDAIYVFLSNDLFEVTDKGLELGMLSKYFKTGSDNNG